ncbi:MAG: alpha/beta fold hydrolase, partial [Candidatus Binatia bacterium]
IGSIALEDYAEDVERVLASELVAASPAEDRIEPVVIGHDIGGVIALSLARRRLCRAVIALAPPLPGTIADEYRDILRRSRRWLGRALAPPVALPGEPSFDASRLQPDSVLAARALLHPRRAPEPPEVAALVVAGDRDPLVERDALAEAARGLGADFAERAAAHWGLEDAGFERHVDQLHRWLVKRLGADLLRLTGSEDLDDDEQP